MATDTEKPKTLSSEILASKIAYVDLDVALKHEDLNIKPTLSEILKVAQGLG